MGGPGTSGGGGCRTPPRAAARRSSSRSPAFQRPARRRGRPRRTPAGAQQTRRGTLMHRRLVEGRLAGDRVVLAEVGGVGPLLRFGGGNARAPCLARGWRSVTVEGSRRNRSVCRASSVGGDTCVVTPALRQASHAVPMHKWSMKWTVARFRSVLCLLGAALVAGSAVASSAEAPLPSPIRLNGEEALVASRTIRLGPGSYQATSVITGC